MSAAVPSLRQLRYLVMLSETLNFAAEMIEGTITDLYIPKKNRGG